MSPVDIGPCDHRTVAELGQTALSVDIDHLAPWLIGFRPKQYRLAIKPHVSSANLELSGILHVALNVPFMFRNISNVLGRRTVFELISSRLLTAIVVMRVRHSIVSKLVITRRRHQK